MLPTATNACRSFQPHIGTAPVTGLSYVRAGVGEPVILLHGWGAFKELWWGTLRALYPSFQAIALDWPGHGSPPLTARCDVLETLAELTADTCAAFGLRQVTLVGHSFGGNVAARVALNRPDLVARLALIDAAIDAQYLGRFIRLYHHPRWGEPAMHLNRHVAQPLIKLGARVPHDHGGGVLKPLARRAYYAARVDPHVLHTFLDALYTGSFSERMPEIRQPTLVVTGARDPVVRPRQAYDLARALPHAHLHVIEGAYHSPMDERPAAFHRVLLDFLQAHPL